MQMDDRQKRAVGALASMVRQYLSQDRERQAIDSVAISAGEHAICSLAEYGYIEVILDGRTFGRWTALGLALLDWDYPASDQASKVFPEPSSVILPPPCN